MKRYLAIVFCVLLALVPAAGAMAAANLPGNLQAIEAEAFAGDSSLSGVLSLPSSVTQIGDRAFADTSLYALKMPSGIQQIGSGILSGSGALYAEIPSATVALADDALDGVTFVIAPSGTVSSAARDEGISWLSADNIIISDGFLYLYTDSTKSAANLILPYAPGISGEYTVPETVGGAEVVEIARYAFAGLDGLTKVSVPDSVYIPLPSERMNWADGLEIDVQIEEVDPNLPEDQEANQFFFEEDTLVLHPGDEFWLSPNLDGVPDGEWSWHSSDESIVTFSEDNYVQAHGVGKAAVTLWIDAAEEGFYYATLTVRIVPADHTFVLLDHEITMPLDEARVIFWRFDSSSHNPAVEYTFESSDENVITLEGDIIHAVGTGTATATVTAIIDGVAVSDSVEVTVVENSLTLSESMVLAYDLFEYQVDILTELPADATVVWSSDNENIHVTQDGLITVSYKDQWQQFGTVTCDVAYADGSSAQASVIVSAITNPVIFDEVTEAFTMNVGDEVSGFASAYIMYFPKDAENFSVTRTSSDESVITVRDDRTLVAHKVGTAEITITVDFLGEQFSSTYQIHVNPPHMWMELEHEDIQLQMTDGEFEMGFWYECSIQLDNLSVTSNNPDVAKAYVFNDRMRIVPVCEGDAIITVTMSAGGATLSRSINVTVYGHTIALSPSSATLKVGESIQLSPVLLEGQEMDYSNISFGTNDESIVHVDQSGRVTALSAGSALVTLHTFVNGEFAYAQCVVTVTDTEAPLTLNHSALHMAVYESVQMTAYWNGTKINDAVWSVTDNGLAITPDGMLFLRHSWSENFAAYVTCTVTREGKTYTATCMVTGRIAEVSMDTPHLVVMSVGDEGWIWTNFSSTNTEETYTVRVSSSDEKIASFPYGDYNLRGNAAGECTVTIELLDSKGSVAATRYCQVMVDMGIPELEHIGFGSDVFYLTTQKDNRTSTWVDPVVLPVTLWDLHDVTITSADPDVAYVDGHNIYAVSAGTTTISICHGSYPDEIATATVYVIDPQSSATATEAEAGDTVTFSVTGFPEEAPPSIWWDKDDYHFTYVNGGWKDITLRTRHEGETIVTAFVDYPDLSFSFDFPLTITGEDLQLNFVDLILDPGKGDQLYPAFEASDYLWSSTNESVATVDEDGYVTAVDYGECDIILNCQTPDGPAEVSCHVTVEDGTWELQSIEMDPVLTVGQDFYVNASIYSTRYAWPDEIVWSFSDDTMVEHIDGDNYRAVKPGLLTVTATAIEDEQVETKSMDIRIIEPDVRMEPTQGYLRFGQTAQMQLITASGMKIESVDWTTSNADALFVDAEGNVTLNSAEGSYSVTAVVTLTDNTTHTLTSVIHAIPDNDVFFNGYIHGYIEMTATTYAELGLDFDTNAAEDEINISWSSLDEDTVIIDSTGDYCNHVANIYALQEGFIQVACNVQIGDFYNETYYIDVQVFAPEMWIDLDRDWIDLYVRDNATEISCWSGNDIPYDVLSVVSSNPSVVKAYMIYDRCFLIPVSEGTATITATISGRGYGDFDTMTVNVYGRRLSLNVEETTLNVGETLQLSPIFTDVQNADYNKRSYQSSDPSIAFVNGDGLVTALKPGKVRIRLQTWVNEEDAVAYCMVNVVDNSYPLTLNADSLSLYCGDTFQLKALWNGKEITDAIWSTDSNGMLVNQKGLVTMHHTWNEADSGYITCTVERDGKTYTASCMVTGKTEGVLFHCENAVSMNVDDWYWFNPYWSVSEDYGELAIVCTSSDKSIVEVDADNRSVHALKAGTCTITVKLVTGEGTVLASKDVTAYVESDLPAMESICFSSDAYYLDMGDSQSSSCHVDPRILPRLYMDMGDLVITIADESIVTIDGHELRAAGVGTTTISMYHDFAPETVVTATVTVYDTTLTISNMTPECGEMVTVSVTGLEDAPLTNFYINSDESMMRFVKQDGFTYYYRAHQPGDTAFDVHADFAESGFCYYQVVTIEGTSLFLNMQDAYNEPGHEFDLWPDFHNIGSWDHVWSSSDESVATVEENGHVIVVGYGECDIVLNCMTDIGACETSCHVYSAEGEWKLNRIDAEDVLYVGNVYEMGCDFDSTYNAGPHEWYWSVEGDALEHLENHRFRAVKSGTATIHLTAIEGDHEESLSRTVLVVEPTVRAEQMYYTERPGTVIKPNIIVAEGLTASSIVLTAEDADALGVSGDSVTVLASEGLHKLSAKVTLTDGSVHELFMWISVIPDWEIYWNLNMDSDWSDMKPVETRNLSLWMDTNAAEHEISIEWACSDEEVLSIDVIEESYANSMISVYANKGGEADITCTVKIGADGRLTTQTFTCHVYVEELLFEMNADTSLREFSMWNSSFEIHLVPNTNIGWDGITAVSSDTSVVRAYISNDWLNLVPVNAGEATVTVTMYRAHLSTTIEIPVKVSGLALQLSKDEVEMTVGESIVLSPILADGYTINIHSRNFQSSNQNVVLVDGDGTVCALSAGTAIISFGAEVDITPDDGEENYVNARGQCVVTVTDAGNPLTLNTTNVQLGWNESFQLKALWNGEEIDDAVWTSDSNSVSVSSTGMVYMRHHWSGNQTCIITATVTRDDTPYTINCLVTALPADERFEMEEAFSMNVGDEHWIYTTIISNVAGESYTFVMTSSDDAIACFPHGDQTLRALAPGHVTVLAEMKNSAGETVASRTCEVYVETELPELESFRLGNDVFYLTLNGTVGGDCHVDPITIPNYIGHLRGVTITAEDPEIVEVDEHIIRGLKVGQTTITATLDEYGNTYTATVYVMDLTLSASADTIGIGDTVEVTLDRTGIPTDDVVSIDWNSDSSLLGFVSGNLGSQTYRGRSGGQAYVDVWVHFPTTSFYRMCEITVEGDAYLLNYSDYRIEPENDFPLWPENFGCEDHVWYSTDESVATVDENGNVHTVDYGECDIILDCTVDGTEVSVSCHVAVVDGTWKLKDIMIGHLMYVGNAYWPNPDISSSCHGAYPDSIELSSSDESILKLSEEDNHFHALKAGEVDITVTATEGERVETITKTFRVIEPAVRLSNVMSMLMTGQTAEIRLVTAPGLSVTNVEWHSANSDAVSIDQDGVLTMHAEEYIRVAITAEVTLSDGSEYTLLGWCEHISE